MATKQYKRLWAAVKEIIRANYTMIAERSIRGVRGSRGIRGSHYIVGDLLAPLIGSKIITEDYNWFNGDQGYASYRDDIWPELEQKEGLTRPEAATVGIVFDHGTKHPIEHLETVWDQARGFIFVEKMDEAVSIQELSDFGWTIVAGRGYPLRLVRKLLKGDTRPVLALHDLDPDGKGIYRALGFETRRTWHLDIALGERVTDLGLSEHDAEVLGLRFRPGPPKYGGRQKCELSALEALTVSMELDNPVLAYVASKLAVMGLKISPTEVEKRDMMERHLRWWLRDGIENIIKAVVAEVTDTWADDGTAVEGYLDKPVVILEEDQLREALKSAAEDLAVDILWRGEDELHEKALAKLSDDRLRQLLSK
ncbi:hypothetical protein ES703_08016 [subsurface metagenome]